MQPHAHVGIDILMGMSHHQKAKFNLHEISIRAYIIIRISRYMHMFTAVVLFMWYTIGYLSMMFCCTRRAINQNTIWFLFSLPQLSICTQSFAGSPVVLVSLEFHSKIIRTFTVRLGSWGYCRKCFPRTIVPLKCSKMPQIHCRFADFLQLWKVGSALVHSIYYDRHYGMIYFWFHDTTFSGLCI